MKLNNVLIKLRECFLNFHNKHLFFTYINLILLLQTNVFGQSPSNISGLKLWLKADAGITLNGANVSNWNDQSGNVFNSIQISTVLQPTYLNNVLNGKPSIHFNGSQMLNGVTIPSISTSSMSLFIVASGMPMSDIYNVLFDIGPYAPGGMWLSKKNNDFTIYSNNAIYSTSNGKLLNTGFSPIIFEYKKNSGVICESFLNTNLNGSSSGSSFVGAFVNGPYNIGGDPTYSGMWNGDVFEIIVFDRFISPSEEDSINNYLIQKYAPSLNLGSDIYISPSNGCIPSNSVSIQANPDFQSYLWSNGATTNQININQYGEYSVICSDIFGINHYDTIKVIPTPKNFNYPNKIMCGTNSITWNTQLNKTINQFLWQNNSTDSLLIINSPGQYFVKITDSFGCIYNSNTVTVTQDNFPTTASLGPDLLLCSGNAISLTNGANAAASYTWSDGSHSNSLVINTTGQYSVVITNTNNCVARDTINVSIAGQAPIANFSQSIGCKNTAVSFTNLSSAPISNTITSTLWDFGDPVSATNTSTLSNPFHTFSDTGNYTVKLKVITNVGCKQTISKTIHIAPTPTVNFSNGISCQNDSTKFTSLINAPSYPITNWLWSFGDAASGASNTSLVANPKHLFSNQTSYTIKLVATNNAGCKDSISKVIIVKAQVKALFSYSAACTNAVVRFQDNSIVPAPASSTVRNWSFGVSTTSTLVSQYYPLAGTYPVTLTVIGTNGCVSYAVKQVTVTLPPVCNFVTPQNFCINDSIKLVDASTSSASSIQNWKWSVNTIPYSTLQSPYLHVTDTANHLIKLRVIDGLGCKDSMLKSVYVYPIPIVDFTSSPNFIFSQTSATLTPNILTGLAYNWTGTNGFSSSLTTPIYQFADTGSYQITLLLTNSRGCKNSKTKSFIVYNKRTDLAILDIVPNIQSDGYLDLTANLANFGTTTITDFKITYKLTNGGQIKENWSGALNAGIFYNYHFSGSALVNEADKNSIVCVMISQVNGGIDDNTKNDNLCLALFVKDIDIFSPYPNPTNNDVVFPIVLKKETNINFDITNALGSSVLVNNSVVGSAGLNLIPLSISNLASGCYIVKITINDKLFIKKIIKY